MPSPMHGHTPPYRLPSNIVYFHDWRYVNHGGLSWVDDDGANPGLWTRDLPERMHYRWHDMPQGIRLRAQAARKSEPVLTPEQANAVFLFGGNLIHDDGTYRLWYENWPEEGIDDPNMGHGNYVRYAESDDGETWRLPGVGLIEHRGSTRNNIVYGAMLTQTGYHGGSVFKDPSAPPAERYKGVNLGDMTPDMRERYLRDRSDEFDPRIGDRGTAVFGSVSPDGIHWTPIDEPFVAQNSDTHNVGLYDEVRGKYVLYCRSWFYQRRTIGRTESDDFRRFPLPEECFWPGPRMAPHDLWYTQSTNRMPGAPDYWVMFPMRWSLPTDQFTWHVATSPDGMVWDLVPGPDGDTSGPVCVPGEPGSWDAGVVAPGLGLVELPGDRMGVLYSGSPVPHKHPRKPPLGKLAWAWWPKGRLVALEAENEGSFALWQLQFDGRTARVNVTTPPAGWLRAEACDQRGVPLPGRSFDDCDPITGDVLDQPITWQGESDLGHAEGAPVVLRFRLRAAKLYSVRFA